MIDKLCSVLLREVLSGHVIILEYTSSLKNMKCGKLIIPENQGIHSFDFRHRANVVFKMSCILPLFGGSVFNESRTEKPHIAVILTRPSTQTYEWKHQRMSLYEGRPSINSSPLPSKSSLFVRSSSARTEAMWGKKG